LTLPAAPSIAALSQSKLSVTWPDLAGFTGVKYEVYLDQSTSPVLVEGNQWTATGLTAGSTHSIRLAYQLSDGRRSPLSDPVSGKTWSEDENFDGLPDDWQALYWGADASNWKSAKEDTDGDGASNTEEFLAGTNPQDNASVLRTRLVSSAEQGWRLEWNTQPGFLYQVQQAAEAKAWTNVGTARFAAGTVDSIPVGGDQDVALYRVIRLR